MEASKWNQHLNSLLNQWNGFLTISLGLLFANFVLEVGLYTKNERVIIMPAYLKQSFWVEGSLISDSYIEEMSLFFRKLMLDTTPDSHKYSKDIILRYVAPEYYHVVKKKLIQYAERMAKEGVSTIFIPKQVKIKSLKSEVTGVLTSYVAGLKVGQTKEIYELEFAYSAGIFMLKGFKTKLEE